MHGPQQPYPPRQQPYPAQHPYQQPYPFHRQPPKKRRTGLIITAIFAAVLLVGGGVAAAVLFKGDGKQAAAPEPEAADTSVIAQKAEPEMVRYGDLAVIDACTVMPATLLEEIGFRDAAHGWHSQSYLPQSVPAADATSRTRLTRSPRASTSRRRRAGSSGSRSPSASGRSTICFRPTTRARTTRR
ncbi:hypothetical protein SK854_19910 [Lentzea sp. BCCO 10_0061]|uniref:Uncharacterized protein n=1 Tax=Lentzea sokolovensis TaxID=3095429 RepID=A0ABU4V055_9PSEU|nr:hypothetical protein [Lentzea sp. BCCO 10_0061]MDX8144393.1 hypothetical protein [Lentzea sp. BCCO 10_0061]